MFCITVALGNVSWRLVYKDEERAREIWETLSKISPEPKTALKFEDDFGQCLVGIFDSIHGLMFEDLEKSALADIELRLHNARIQAKAQKLASADPSLRPPMMGNPAILNPMGNGSRPF